MASNVIKEWLIDYKALPESQLNTYAATVRRNVELTTALYQLLEEDLVQEVLDPVCHQLFDFYRSPLAELRRFTLELVPALITAYLFAVARNEKKKCGGIEVLLLGIYNLEIVDTSGKSRVRTYTIPSLASPSIYHEPPSLATLALTESSLMRYHNDEPITLTVGPMSHVESINAQNRLSVLTYIMSMYNMEIGELGPNSHFSVCTMCSRLCKNGFDSLADDMLSTSQGAGSRRQSRRSSVSFRQDPRIPLASNFLVECLNGLYYAIFNGQAREGLLALDLIHMRASYELYPDVLLVTNAIRNSLAYNPSGQPEDGPMGISIALSPNQTHNPSFLKDAITNASFRTKRMPEDIGPESDEETEHETSTEHDANKSPNRKLSVGKKEKRKNSDVHSPSAMDNLRTRFRIRRSSSISVPHKEDIEVPDDAEDNPPHYDDVVPASLEDKKTSAMQHLAKPLKSIMKNREKDKSKTQVGRKESGRSPRDIVSETSSPKSPKHSSSLTNSLSSHTVPTNGDVADHNMVRLNVVVRSNSKSVAVDQLSALELTQLDGGGGQPRSTSFPDGIATGNHHNDSKAGTAQISTSHSREISLNNGGSGSHHSSNNSLNTAL